MSRTLTQAVGRMMMGVASVLAAGAIDSIAASEPFVIAASPSMAAPIEALSRAFEAKHPEVNIQLHYGSGLELRQMIATMENRYGPQYFIGSGPIHVIAPGGDELITRLEMRYYVLSGSRTPYATASLVLIVPESLVDAPSSFEAAAKDGRIRIAVADPKLTALGQKTDELLHALGGTTNWDGRLDIATDARGVLDHLLNGKADAAIIFAPDAVREANRVRVVAMAQGKLDRPVTHSMAMERYCPNRLLCDEFLKFVQSAEAETIIKKLGYGIPRDARQ